MPAMKPWAVRVTEDEREKLAAYGNSRAAITALLALAEEHQTCGPPRRTKGRATIRGDSITDGAFRPPTRRSAAPVVAVSTLLQYVVHAADGRELYRSGSRVLAEKRLAANPGSTLTEERP